MSTVDGGSTRLELEHSAVVPDDAWAEYGPGAVGIGWDQALVGLTRHLHGESIDDPAAWPTSAEGCEFSRKSSERGAARIGPPAPIQR